MRRAASIEVDGRVIDSNLVPIAPPGSTVNVVVTLG
jgi:hypothetical protein